MAARAGAPVVLAGRSAAGSLVADLERAGVVVHALSAADVAVACGWFFDAVSERRVVVQRDTVLDRAVRAARRRQSPSGSWVWDRAGDGDVHPLVALTFAAWWAARPVVAEFGPSVYDERGLVSL